MSDGPDAATGSHADERSPTLSSPSSSRRFGDWALGLWWGAMFLGTHIPLPNTPGESPIPDKLIHFVMYFGLGWLLPAAGANRERPTWRQIAACFAGIAAYAVLDELLQIPVGRTAEWWDGVADLAGAACGLLLARWRPLRGKSSQFAAMPVK
jgi:VanZ family protein